MSKWENKYKKIKSGDYDTAINNLKQKIDNKTINKDEYKIYEKLNKAKSNLPSVEKIIEYRNKVISFRKDLDNEIELRKLAVKTNEKMKKLDKKMEELEKKEKEIENKIKNADKNSKEYKELYDEQKKLREDRNANNSEFSIYQQVLNNIKENENEKFKGKTNKDLKNTGLKLKSTLSKCDIVINNMLEGKSWKAIDYEIKKFNEPTKYTTEKQDKLYEKKKDLTKQKADDNQNKNENDKKLKIDKKEYEDIFSSNEKEEEFKNKKEKENKAKEKRKSFKDRFARIGNWFKKIFNKGDNNKYIDESKDDIDIKKVEDIKEEDLKLDEDFLSRIKVMVKTDKEILSKYEEYKKAKQEKYKENPEKLRCKWII